MDNGLDFSFLFSTEEKPSQGVDSPSQRVRKGDTFIVREICNFPEPNQNHNFVQYNNTTIIRNTSTGFRNNLPSSGIGEFLNPPSDQLYKREFDANQLLKYQPENEEEEEEEVVDYQARSDKKRKLSGLYTKPNQITHSNSFSTSLQLQQIHPTHHNNHQTSNGHTQSTKLPFFPIIEQPKSECTVGKNRACKVKIQLSEDQVQDIRVHPYSIDRKHILPGFLQSIKLTTTEVCVTFNGMKLLRQKCESGNIPFETNMSIVLGLSHPDYAPIFTTPVKLISKTLSNPESKKNKEKSSSDDQCP